MNGPDYDRLATLMARALNGDACAYEAALRDIARIVRAYARGRLGETIADDVVQDTLLAVHRARHTYDPDRPFGPWLMAIAHSRVVDTARRLRRLRLQNGQLQDVFGGGAEHHPEQSMTVAQALQRLPHRQRRVIELLKLEGWSAREVAIALGLSVSNVKVIAHRGYDALRRSLKDG